MHFIPHWMREPVILSNTMLKSILSHAVILAIASGCSVARPGTSAKLDGLSATSNGGNVALLFQANIPEADNDLSILETVLSDSQANYGFDVKTHSNVSSSAILSDIRKYAPQVGADGTLFLYLAGHGSPNGYMQTYDGSFLNFSDIQKTLARARSAPFKRLVVMVFSCFGGNWIDEVSSLRLADASDASTSRGVLESNARTVAGAASSAFGSAAAGSYAGQTLFQEFLVVTSSSTVEESFFSGNGSEFANAISSAWTKLRASGAQKKISDFVDAIVRIVPSSTPQVRASPESILGETLFDAADGSTSTASTDLYLKLGALKTDGTQDIFVAGDTTVKGVVFCWDTLDHCTAASGTKFRALTTKVTGRAVFGSAQAMTVTPGQAMTILGLDAAGSVIRTHELTFKEI